jgi:hypothetical protein
VNSSALVDPHRKNPDIIAHSLGTHFIGQIIERFPAILIGHADRLKQLEL